MGLKNNIKKKVEANPLLKKKTSEILTDFLEDDLKGKGDIKLQEIFDVLKHRGFGLLFIFFGIIGVLALPPLSTIAAIPLIYLSFQFFLNYKSPFFPKFIKEKSFEKKNVSVAINKAINFTLKIEKYIKPRFSTLFLPLSERVVGLLMILFCCSILIPLPMTNFLPSIAIISIGFGMIEKDGIMTMIGIALGLFGWFVTIMIILFGIEIFERIF